MIMFNTIDEMLAVLTSYRTKYNRYNELNAKLDGVKSPRLTDEAISTVPTSQEHRYNQNIEERDELTNEMRQIEDVIISIKSVDYLSFVILWDKFIEFETLEEISFSVHYSFQHIRQTLYPRAKRILFEHHTQTYKDE